MRLTSEQREELDALRQSNDALEQASFLHNSHMEFYKPLSEAGLVEIGDAPGGFDPRSFFGATITDAGRAALAE